MQSRGDALAWWNHLFHDAPLDERSKAQWRFVMRQVSAHSMDGSWWPHWYAWLDRHAGRLRAATRRCGNARYPVIEPAPGRYVKVRA